MRKSKKIFSDQMMRRGGGTSALALTERPRGLVVCCQATFEKFGVLPVKNCVELSLNEAATHYGNDRHSHCRTCRQKDFCAEIKAANR